MAGMILLGLWLTLPPRQARTPGATAFEVNFGSDAEVVEQLPPGTPGGDPSIDGPQYRFMRWPEGPSPWMDGAAFERALSSRSEGMASRPWLLQALKVSSWVGVLWFMVGLTGQMMFFGRMLVQWVTAERKGQVVIPPSFWWMSLLGGLMLFTYFVWRREPIGVLGQSTGIVIYARNIRLIGKEKRRLARAEASPPSE